MSKILGFFLELVGSTLCGIVVGTSLPDEGWSDGEFMEGPGDGVKVGKLSEEGKYVGCVEAGNNVSRTREGGGVEDGEGSKDASDEGFKDLDEKNENGLEVGGSFCGKMVLGG